MWKSSPEVRCARRDEHGERCMIGVASSSGWRKDRSQRKSRFGISETALLPYRGIVLSLLLSGPSCPSCSSFRSHASCPVAVRPLVQPSVSLSARAAVAVPGGGAVHEMCSRSWNPLRNKRIIEVFPCLPCRLTLRDCFWDRGRPERAVE